MLVQSTLIKNCTSKTKMNFFNAFDKTMLITNCLCWKVSTKFQVGDNKKFQYRKFLEISSCLWQVFLEKCSLNLIPSLQATTTDINTFIDESQVLINSHLRQRKRDRLHLPWLIGQKPKESLCWVRVNHQLYFPLSVTAFPLSAWLYFPPQCYVSVLPAGGEGGVRWQKRKVRWR